jgi:MFS family permease
MTLPKLNPDEILRAEYDYIAQCAFQANEDRARVASFYFISVGSLVAAILGSQFAGGKLSGMIYLSFGLLFVVLTILGAVTIFQLARLRAAWNSAVSAMNAVKNFYIEKYPDLKTPIKWRKVPERENWYSIANLLRIQIGLLSGMTFAAASYTLFRSFSSELVWWEWGITIVSPLVLYFLEWRWYHQLLKK